MATTTPTKGDAMKSTTTQAKAAASSHFANKARGKKAMEIVLRMLERGDTTAGAQNVRATAEELGQSYASAETCSLVQGMFEAAQADLS